MSVRPREANPGISYYNGKGTTRSDAHAGAIMEAIERHGGEHCFYEIITGSYEELSKRVECVDPAEIIIPRVREVSPKMNSEWVAGYDLINKKSSHWFR